MKKLILLAFMAGFCLKTFALSPSADTLKTWLSYIASDEMKGRANGSKELATVINWLSGEFSGFGMQPLQGQSDFRQSFELDFRGQTVPLTNLIGYFPGKNGWKSPMILLSAHVDHIGIRRNNPSDTICNGADDDGSGVIGLLGLAKRLHDSNKHLDYSIVVAVFSGEELGLKGSAYFCEHPLIPFKQVELNMNIEMIGHSQELGRNRYYITGPSQSGLGAFLNKYNEDKAWKIADIGEKAEMYYRMADNYSIVTKVNNTALQVPAHTFAVNTGEGYLHRPTDEVKDIDFENMNSFVDYLFDLMCHISQKGGF